MSDCAINSGVRFEFGPCLHIAMKHREIFVFEFNNKNNNIRVIFMYTEIYQYIV